VRRKLSVALVAASLLPATGVAGEDAEVERAWHGRLPSPDSEGYGATRIVDAATGKPIPGARLRSYTEDIRPIVVRYADLLGEGIADEDGFAWASFGGWDGDRHWAAHAPGYAATSEYGYRPPAELALEPGVEVSGRILGPFGVPLGDVAIEARVGDGCPHVPALVEVRTARDGTFVLRDASPNWTLWLAPARRGATEDSSVPDLHYYGDRRREIVLSTGWTAVGRVLDREGAPIPGVVVRPASGYPRGPVAVTGLDGSFRLPGVEPRTGLWFVHPRAQTPEKQPTTDERTVLDEWVDRVPLTVRLGVGEFAWREGTSLVRIRIRTAQVPAPTMSVRWTRTDDGRSWLVRAEPDDGGVSTAEAWLPPGRYVVSPGSPFDPVAVRPVSVDVAADGDVAVDLWADAQPRLVVEGDSPDAPLLTLVVPGGEIHQPTDGPGKVSREAWVVHLPSCTEAVVQQETLGGIAFLPVEPESNGIRRVRLRQDVRHRVRWRPLDEGEAWIETRDGVRVEQAGFDHDESVEGLATRACGDLVLVVESGDRGGRLPIHLPTDRAVDLFVQVDAALRAPREATIDVSAPGVDRSARVVVESVSGPRFKVVRRAEEGEPPALRLAMALQPIGLDAGPLQGVGLLAGEEFGSYPCRVTIRARGAHPPEQFQPLDLVVQGPGAHRATWGTCSLVVDVVYEVGAPAAARIAVDGHVHAAPGGTVTVRGLSPGLHRVLVVPSAGGAGKKELILRLRDGETRTRRVVVATFDSTR
jgi:hypothetical protein